MEKLLNLLNEYDKLENHFTIGKRGWFGDCVYEDYLPSMSHLILISKSYGFIERLVKNDKIDDSKVGNSDMLSVQYHDLVNDYKYEGLIMILSISENPISDLCSFLKE